MKNVALIILLYFLQQFILLEISFGQNYDLSCKEKSLKFEHHLIHEVQKGIPVEVVGILSDKENILCKNVIHITYDLWDEVADLEMENQKINRIKLDQISNEICERFKCLDNFDRYSKPQTRFRILLNTMWEGRANKYLKNNAKVSEIKFFHFSAKSIAQELPSEIVLLDQEIKK